MDFDCPYCKVSFEGIPEEWVEPPRGTSDFSESTLKAAAVVGFLVISVLAGALVGFDSGSFKAILIVGFFVFLLVMMAINGGSYGDSQTQRNNQRLIGFQQRKEMNEKLEDIRDSIDPE